MRIIKTEKRARGVLRHSGDAKCVAEILGEEGAKIRKFGTKFKFGQLISILRKIIKTVATRYQILQAIGPSAQHAADIMRRGFQPIRSSLTNAIVG